MIDFHASLFEAAQNVMSLMFGIDHVSKSSTENFMAGTEIDISVGVVGDYEGELIYRFPEEVSLKMVNTMSGMEVESVDDFVTSAISETANIISGNVLTILADNGNVKCDILPPVLQLPADKPYSIHESCSVTSEIGNIYLGIRLNTAI
ncbi:chemotaxis protein CheX [Scatolibacter rhodanostii]|uniref:chemotaxis protein CheX n=1 Tax=Scatolibacter rhodanostii TaxID=2014781 RepID=UPI000C07EF37|nr:chemotaxis protein CheX [Scatolibacter rhodanostii]